ncbi:solute carrier family 30 member 1 [Streptomyces laurentii]|uniref:Solute carrier family 30 member 1 n=1 Tax=Streptomyces laurentii TaxID=39478 RepID=A0A160P8U6_STRLU|nr:solute carrier family 30 member 1 [Streptomyces laurentii]
MTMANTQPQGGRGGQSGAGGSSGSGAGGTSDTTRDYPRKLTLKSLTAGANPRKKPKSGGA